MTPRFLLLFPALLANHGLVLNSGLPGHPLITQETAQAPKQPLRPDDLMVIINPESGVNAMTEEEVVHLFMGRQKRLGSGRLAIPVEPAGELDLRTRFYDVLVHASLPQVRSYWARMWFSGQAQPPLQAQNSKEVIEMVRANKGAIGFVARSELAPGVKTVLVLHAPVKP
jgi:hypothetical protein